MQIAATGGPVQPQPTSSPAPVFIDGPATSAQAALAVGFLRAVSHGCGNSAARDRFRAALRSALSGLDLMRRADKRGERRS